MKQFQLIAATVFSILSQGAIAQTLDCNSEFHNRAQQISSLRSLYETYLDVSYDIVTAAIPSLRQNIDGLRQQFLTQRMQVCSETQRRYLESELMRLRSEIDRLAVDSEMQSLRDQANSI